MLGPQPGIGPPADDRRAQSPTPARDPKLSMRAVCFTDISLVVREQGLVAYLKVSDREAFIAI